MTPSERLRKIQSTEPYMVSGANVRWLIERVRKLEGALEVIAKQDIELAAKYTATEALEEK